MVDIVIINTQTREVVARFTKSTQEVPKRSDLVWVPDNGNVAFEVTKRQFDYEKNEARILCKPNPEAERIE